MNMNMNMDTYKSLNKIAVKKMSSAINANRSDYVCSKRIQILQIRIIVVSQINMMYFKIILFNIHYSYIPCSSLNNEHPDNLYI